MKFVRHTFILLLAVSRLLAADPVDPAATRQGAFRASIAQETLRNDADTVRSTLATLLAEARLNGIGSDDAEALRPVLSQLGAITENEMQAVIDSLKSAGLSSDQTLQQSAILEASQGQQTIANRLYSLASSVGVRQAKEALPRDLRDLLGRQLANLRLTLRHQLLPAEGNETARATIARSQQAIADDTATLLNNLREIISALSNGEAKPFEAALDYIEKENLIGAVRAASQTATDGVLTTSTRHQARVRDILLAASQTMTSRQTPAEQLVQMSETLERLISEQIELIAAASRSEPADTSALAARQTSLADETGILRTLNPELAPAFAATVEEARLAMQAAANMLARNETGAASRASQQTALDALRQSRTQLADQMQTESESLADAAGDLADAQQQVTQAQQALRQQDNAAGSEQLQTASDTAQEAAAQSGVPPAAQQAVAAAQADLSAAANAADQADTAAAQQAAAEAAQDLASAQAAVNQAQAALDQQSSAAQTNASAQAAQNLQAAQQAADQAAESLQSDSANAAEQAAAAQQAAAAAAQAAAAQQAANAASPPNGSAGTEAEQAMQAAGQALQEASQAAQSGQSDAAQQATARAQAALAAAADAQAQALAQSQSHGLPQDLPGNNEGDPANPDGSNPMNGLSMEGDGLALSSSSNAGFGGGQVVTSLNPRDRDAIRQAQADKTPPEFTPLIRQYLKNLADGTTP